MGPGCFHPRNTHAGSFSRAIISASMGPGCFHPRNERRLFIQDFLSWLQWGRDVSIPEMCIGAGDGTYGTSFNGAGMFPSQKSARAARNRRVDLLQWGRDVSIPEMTISSTSRRWRRGFNGAGMFPSQKSVFRRVIGVGFHRFNGAGMFPSQKCVDVAQVVPISSRFNGAGMFPSQKFGRAVVRPHHHGASMGPGCFHPRNGRLSTSSGPCYTASMGPGCFHPRNPLGWPTNGRRKGQLQWGRDVSIPEIRRWHHYVSGLPGFNGAGMFPSQKSLRSQRCRHRYSCFNGAGMFPSQKCKMLIGPGIMPEASMGPGCFHPRNSHCSILFCFQGPASLSASASSS